MTPQQRRVIDGLDRMSPPGSKLLRALKKKFRTPKECILALGLDEKLLAFDEAPRGFSASRAVGWLRSKGLSEADCDEFLKYLGGAEAEDRGSRARDHATSEAHNAMEAAAHSDPMERDEMPNYGANHMPRHALDSAPAWKAARAIAPGLANIKLGPIGWH